jgi:[ribosomal protein S5]-alanine N-acetyltransferase
MPLPGIPGYVVAPLAVADAADWARFALLPEVMRYTSTVATSAADLVPMIERTLAADPNAPVLFGVRDAASRQLVACVGFHTVSALHRTAEVTYTVHPERWGRGLATAACDAAVRWAFTQRGWVRVQATTLEPHVASQRVLLKCGFEFEGRLRNFRIVRGQPHDYLLYARVPADR